MLLNLSSLKVALGAAVALATSANAMFPDEAGQIDWYRKQIGVPKEMVPLASSGNSKGGILAITHHNVLASLNSTSGEIDWRHIFDDSDPIKILKVRGNQALTLSGANETAVRVWDTQSGSISWAFTQPATPKYLAGSGTAEFIHDSKDVVAVAGDSLVRLSADKSKPAWVLPLNHTAAYKRIVVQDKVVFAIGDARRTKKKSKARLHVAEVDLATGALKQQYDVSEEAQLNDGNVVVIESSEYGGYILWREPKNIVWYIHRLGMTNPIRDMYHAKMIQIELDPEDMLGSTLKEIDADPGLNADRPRFAMTYTKEGKAKTIVVEMYRDDDELKMRKVVGFRSDNAIVFGNANRVGSQSDRAVVAVKSAQKGIQWRMYVEDKTPTHSGELDYDADTYGPVRHAFLRYASDGEPQVVIRTEGGLVVAVASGKHKNPLWFRDESLAHAADMEFLELPTPETLSEHTAKATDPSVVGSPVARYILRWVETTKSLTQGIMSGFGLFGLSSETNNANSRHAAGSSIDQALVPKAPLTVGDHFGFRKLSIFGTSTGVLAAVGTDHGARSWTRFFADNGTAVGIENVFITRRSQPLSTTSPLVTAVGRNAQGNIVIAVFDALTGKPVADHDQGGGDSLLQQRSILPSEHSKVFKLPVVDPDTKQQLLGVVTVDGQLHTWPFTDNAVKAFCEVSDSVFFDAGTDAGSTKVSGYRAGCTTRAGQTGITSERVWGFDLPAGETLIKAVGYEDGAQNTALLGRALGDRSVLYKYLNPHLVTLFTRHNADQDRSIGVYLIDRVTGRLLYSTVHENASVTEKRPLLAIQTENRVIYQYWQNGIPSSSSNSTDESVPAARGYVTVVAELFESDKPDTRNDAKTFTSFDMMVPHVVTSAFTSPEPASALGVTRTGSHISTRDVLFGLSSGKLLGLPDQMLDPRRPQEAPTKDEQAEGLIPYMPALPLDPKRVLSHYHGVAKIAHIKAAPTHLESTSLVASFGLDLFFTRTSPSGTFDQLSPSFSKVNLVVTTLALVVGCVLGGPMVRRKMTSQAWA